MPGPERRRRIPFAGGLAVILIVSCSAAHALSDGVERSSPADRVAQGRAETDRAIEADRQGDPALALKHWRNALSFRPDHPSLILNTAAAAAQAGQAEDALNGIDRYASMGLTAAIAEEPALASLFATPRFREALRRLESNRQPIGRPEVAWTVPLPGFFTEAIAFDRALDDLYLSGFQDGRIVRFHDGEASTVHQSELCVLGLALDLPRRILWATASALPEARPATAERKGTSELIRYELDTGQATRFACTLEGESQLGDLGLLPDGTVLLSDGLQRSILAFDPRSGTFRRWSEIELPSPQGIAISEDGQTVFVADYAAGLFRLSADGGGWIRLVGDDDLTTLGFDGLAYQHPFLVGVQNGVRPQRIVRLEVDSDQSRIVSWKVLASSLPDFDEPTQGFIRDHRFVFIANSHWPQLDLDPESISGLSPPLILSVAID